MRPGHSESRAVAHCAYDESVSLSFTAPSASLTRTWSAVLFDLDGTLIHSAPLILEGLAHVHESFGLAVPSEAELMDWIGPPVYESLRERAMLSEAEALRARAMYRDYTAGSELHVAMFPGVLGLLQQLGDAGIPIALATSKPEHTARGILEHRGVAERFAAIVGASDEAGRASKADVVGEALLRLAAAGIDIEAPVMVGDRGYDTAGAAEHGVPTILVEWGYGNPSEANDALAVVASADQLRSLLLGA